MMVRQLVETPLAPHELHHVRLNFSLEMEELGRITPRKIWTLASTIAAIAAKRFTTKSEALLYVPAGPDLNPVLRDIAVLICVRWMFRWTLFHFHAGGVMEYVATLNPLLRTLARLAYRNPDLTIRTSATAPADGIGCGTRRDVVVANCSADLGPVPQRACRARPRILYVGVLKQDKGILVLLESMRLLRERGHDFDLYLVGDSVPRQFRRTVERAIDEHGLRDRVTITGILVGEAKRQIFRSTDVFCFPTFFASETFGLVVIEAMSAGMPVVATDWRGLRTIIDEGRDGFLVPPRDPAALADRLGRLLQDPALRARMGAAGRRKYDAMFTPEAFALRMRAQLDEFAAASGDTRSVISEGAERKDPCDRKGAGTSPTVNILGAEVAAINLESAASIIDGWIRAGRREYVCVADVHALMQGHKDRSLRTVQNNAGLITPDGMPLVWISRLAGHRDAGRVYGPDLLLRVCRHGVRRGYRHFFYGGKPGIAAKLAGRLSGQIPGLAVCGTLAPPLRTLTQDEDWQAVAAINAADPDIVWVGLGAPKQDWWMADHRDRLNASVLIGVGAAFDFLSGEKRQAPVWMQRSGLEWVHRLMTEPRRLWRRYLWVVPSFIGLLSLQLLHLQRFEGNQR